MCRKVSSRVIAVTAAMFLAATTLPGQTAATDWRHIGNSAIDLGLASLATGPVDRVWYSEDGQHLFARTHAGRTFETDDFEQWRSVAAVAPPAEENASVVSRPDGAAKIKFGAGNARLYGIGNAVYRSEDGGASWSNLTQYQRSSLLGGGLTDLATSPQDPDEIVVAASTGVWRSLDGGLSWTGLNQLLPNLPARKIYGLPSGSHGLRISLSSPDLAEAEWAPGEQSAWKLVSNVDVTRDETVKAALARAFTASITAIGGSGNYLYAGSSEGQLWASGDRGATWSAPSDRLAGSIESIYVSSKDARIALAAVGARNPGANASMKLPHVLRTMNGGIFWDDIGANLADAAAHGVVADPSSGAVYVATDAGVFLTTTDLGAAGRATTWTSTGDNLPKVPATDVKLDAGGNQLFVALEGQGVYVTIAPHRLRDVHVVNAADYSSRAAAPGGLLSVIGMRVQSAQTAESPVPVLDASDTASQIQVPFTAKGTAISLSLAATAGKLTLGLPLQTVSPAIFVNPDGSPWVLDAESGVLLDSNKPARARSRIQILATGLGRVTPDWPAGVAAPLSNPPRVQANLRVYLDHVPLELIQATLAPGYIGSYLVEAQIPAIVNNGPAELYVEAEGQASNHVRIYLQQ